MEMNGDDVIVSSSVATVKYQNHTALHILHHPIQKLMAARHQSMGRSLSYGWVGGFLTETKVMQLSRLIIYIQLSIIMNNHSS